MKKGIKVGIAIVCILIIIFLIYIFTLQNENIENKGTQTFTIMIYMCASDLESENGFASSDLEEMLNASLDQKINFIIQTGGTSKWQNFNISNNSNQIYKVENGQLILVKDLGQKEMTDENNLSEFIGYCKNTYPADRYGLILWDHGGGAISGYGHDENFQNENTITIDELKTVTENSKIKFDFIGFDACLMANIETAYSLKNVANYLIASEETEPGTGWDYTSFLNRLSTNTSASTPEFSNVIVDSFIKSNSGENADAATLSVIDLSKMDDVYLKLTNFIKDIKTQLLDNNQFASISKAVNNTKSYGDGEVDTIDLQNFAQKINNSKSEELVNAIKSAVIYNKTNNLVKDSNGMSIYFPATNLEYYENMLEIYPKVGIGKEYTDTLTEYINMLAGGQTGTYSINSNTYSTEENYQQYGWYNSQEINSNADYYQENKYDQLQIIDKGEYYALQISDDDWKNILNITCEVMYDDGEGYVDLGSDNYYETDGDGDLKVTFDGTWISIQGKTVPFYVLESDDNYTKGRTPVYINDELYDLILIWNKENPNGKVLGAKPVNSYGDTTITAKGLREIKKDDKIEFLFDYYKYDGTYEDSYIIGDTLIVDNPNFEISYKDVEKGEFYIYYKITDIYGNKYYTQPVTLY